MGERNDSEKMVVLAVWSEPVSGTNSLISAIKQGIFTNLAENDRFTT